MYYNYKFFLLLYSNLFLLLNLKQIHFCYFFSLNLYYIKKVNYYINQIFVYETILIIIHILFLLIYKDPIKIILNHILTV